LLVSVAPLLAVMLTRSIGVQTGLRRQARLPGRDSARDRLLIRGEGVGLLLRLGEEVDVILLPVLDGLQAARDLLSVGMRDKKAR